jgi:spoIIIJ-associated protein
MEWIETTGRSVEEAKELALDRLGVDLGDAEFQIVSEPKPGLFGRMRGEARVRARVRPASPRPKQERRRRGGRTDEGGGAGRARSQDGCVAPSAAGTTSPANDVTLPDTSTSAASPAARQRQQPGSRRRGTVSASSTKERPLSQHDEERSKTVDPAAVGETAATFISGLTDAFGLTATTSLHVEGTELEVTVEGTELGLLVGPAGRTLAAIQDLARVAAQRRLGDHATRLRIDVAGYRERRRAALERFATTVADEVRTSGTPRALEPMPPADRKVIHDVLSTLDGVTSRSEGDEPRRRIVVSPA